jgi:hypothetical protein
MASQPIFQFYAELTDFKPKIWRRFQVMNDTTVVKLGYIIQILFEMKASHLMAIEVPKGENFYAYIKTLFPDKPDLSTDYGIEPDLILRYEVFEEDIEMIPEPYRNEEVLDAKNEKIKDAVSIQNDKLNFFYDYGDGWIVSLVLEKVFIDKELPGSELPRVLEGENFGIIEDVGGIWGLTELVKSYKTKKGQKYKSYSEWLGVKEFDISSFNIEDLNFRLKKLPRIYKEIYEDYLEPTQNSIDLIERKYLKGVLKQ